MRRRPVQFQLKRSGIPAIVSRAGPYFEVKLHLSEQKALAVAILLEGMAIFILIVVFAYYAVQAEASMKPDSPWKWRLDATWKEAWHRYKARGLRAIPPHSEFTELGLWYRRRAAIWGIVIAVCLLVFAAFDSALTSWYERF
jgi:hypothetical protein